MVCSKVQMMEIWSVPLKDDELEQVKASKMAPHWEFHLETKMVKKMENYLGF